MSGVYYRIYLCVYNIYYFGANLFIYLCFAFSIYATHAHKSNEICIIYGWKCRTFLFSFWLLRFLFLLLLSSINCQEQSVDEYFWLQKQRTTGNSWIFLLFCVFLANVNFKPKYLYEPVRLTSQVLSNRTDRTECVYRPFHFK